MDEWMDEKRTGSPEEAGHVLNTILQFSHSFTQHLVTGTVLGLSTSTFPSLVLSQVLHYFTHCCMRKGFRCNCHTAASSICKELIYEPRSQSLKIFACYILAHLKSTFGIWWNHRSWGKEGGGSVMATALDCLCFRSIQVDARGSS